MKLRTLGIALLGTVGLTALSACKQESPPAPVPAEPPARTQDAAAEGSAAEASPEPEPLTGGGTVQGTITFKGTPPTPAPITPSQDPACQGMPPADQSLQVKAGKLENVLVRVRGLMPLSPRTRPAVVDQKQCSYTPRVQGVAVGQPILIKNSDGTLHNARAIAGTRSIFNVAQPPRGKPVQRTLPAEAEVVRLKCDIHPWMVSWVVVNPNPYFATSNADGAYTIEHLPAGTYTLEAWHEVLGTKTAEITVKEGETTALAFEFSAEDAKGSASSAVK
ncbi:carboxypeptidase regulatory-like domain-containing protein [Cystobacter ferrugineus]|uniref:TonB-dependent receptor n=1 Tax=Cystobacter ferrugineus TaxID=83449 RepID=A0A1L9BFE2_9BACT|nr:carboxypeptidase regulatory-like domain-containing protein [Cystobacter ferrugineus]OJH40979.1 TonB-dependent receptor [Cystobacter ferrugineus]